MKPNYINSAVLLFTVLLFTSCKDNAFTKTKSGTKETHSLDGSTLVKIKSYSLTYNPKSNGSIKLELESGAEYLAKSVDGGSISSINSLLNETDVLFDTTREELIINKSIQD